MCEEDRKPGPDADRLKIEGDWEDAVKRALKKPQPIEGWPKADTDEDDEKDQPDSD